MLGCFNSLLTFLIIFVCKVPHFQVVQGPAGFVVGPADYVAGPGEMGIDSSFTNEESSAQDGRASISLEGQS